MLMRTELHLFLKRCMRILPPLRQLPICNAEPSRAPDPPSAPTQPRNHFTTPGYLSQNAFSTLRPGKFSKTSICQFLTNDLVDLPKFKLSKISQRWQNFCSLRGPEISVGLVVCRGGDLQLEHRAGSWDAVSSETSSSPASTSSTKM